MIAHLKSGKKVRFFDGFWNGAYLNLHQCYSLTSFHAVWGEHMHHGYYVPEDRTDHVQAQIDLIDEVLKWAGVPEPTGDNQDELPKKCVDVGCGIGGSSRHIAKKYGCTANGITLSPYQAGRGNELAKEQGVDDLCSFQVADALEQPFEDNTFDLIWSLESGGRSFII